VLPMQPTSGFAWVDEGPVAWAYRVGSENAAALPSILGPAGSRVTLRRDLRSLGLAHPRAGEFLLTATRGWTFMPAGAFYPLRGNHGSSRETSVPFIVLGGHRRLRAMPAVRMPMLPDVAPTVTSLLGLRAPRRLGTGGPLPRVGQSLPIWAPAVEAAEP